MPKLPATYDPLETERAIDDQVWPFVSRNVYSVTDLPDAARYPYKFALVSDGTSNRNTIQSNGTTWRYLDGSPV